MDKVVEATGYDQGIGIILYVFTNCPNIYQVVTVYHHPVQPSNNISLVDLKRYVGLQEVTFEIIEHCGFVDPQGCSWRSTYQTRFF